MTYQVEVYTGTEDNSGTDAHVYAVLYGSRGDTGKRQLMTRVTDQEDGHKLFESGRVCKKKG